MALFSIHPSLPFLETAFQALTSGTLLTELNSPNLFCKATIFVPSHHAAQMFARLVSHHHYPHPKIISLGHLPEDFESAGLPRTLSPQKFQLLLAKRIQKCRAKTEEPISLSTAYSLSSRLLEFFDTVTVNHISVEDIRAARERGLPETSELLSVMLNVLTSDLPRILEDEGAITALQRARIQLDRYGERLRCSGSSHAVVILGSTGSQMSTRILMKHVSGLPNGLVILPGIDYESRESTWLAYGSRPTHPQMLLSRFVQSCNQSRSNIIPVHHSSLPPSGSARGSLLIQTLTIPEETSSWAEQTPTRTHINTAALEGLAIGIAHNERHEATLIASALHKACLKGAQRPTLITPDRTLADYTFQELQRWPYPVLMTAPSSLSSTVAGRVALLSLALLSPPLSPTTLSALLGHPWVTLGLEREIYTTCRPLWDTLFLRHLSPKGSIELLLTRLQAFLNPVFHTSILRTLPRESHETFNALTPPLKEALSQGIHRLVNAYGTGLSEQGRRTLGAFIKHHLLVLETLIGMEDLRKVRAFPEAKPLFDLLDSHAESDILLSLEDYKTLLELMIKETQVFPKQEEPQGPCIQISGLWEARFLSPDYVVLGGLTEAVWPPSPSLDPLFGRVLTEGLGLPSPEIRIGQSAHDFIQILCRTPQAFITYSRKRNNAPVLPSRFLLRLQACLGDTLWKRAHTQGEQLCAVEETSEQPIHHSSLEYKGSSSLLHHQTLSIPGPLSVHALERLVSDPGAFFTRHVLGLQPSADRILAFRAGTYSTLIHHILDSFSKAYPIHIPQKPLDALLSIGAEAFTGLKEHDEGVHHLWWSKFQHIAETFSAWEEKRRPFIERVSSSVSGRAVLKIGAESLTIMTLTDRVEKRHDGSYVLIDFKTGTLPSHKDVHAGLALSLVLQGASLEQGRLDSVPQNMPYHLTYVHISPGSKGFEERTLSPPKDIPSLSAFVTLILTQLEDKINDYASKPEAVLSA